MSLILLMLLVTSQIRSNCLFPAPSTGFPRDLHYIGSPLRGRMSLILLMNLVTSQIRSNCLFPAPSHIGNCGSDRTMMRRPWLSYRLDIFPPSLIHLVDKKRPMRIHSASKREIH
ncbi:hypothetical protein GYMLUDRAFT_667934 [Collybiopsis luxurians FD-317 M1]|uniref:Secreted protein n=1 Tax=Collybiopsis luxurians FD-317 M1 TaxID=944289 RepID=A0A0D0CAG2_9AGAR|nr:hypothetical protein GYMLUDRAFT_667934 [Collybiopsis luxurians FD-317 M1]